MVTVPAATPVTSPREETVAMSSSELAQGDVVAGFPDPVSVVVASTHTLVLPLMVGVGFTVTVMEACAPSQPVLSLLCAT